MSYLEFISSGASSGVGSISSWGARVMDVTKKNNNIYVLTTIGIYCFDWSTKTLMWGRFFTGVYFYAIGVKNDESTIYIFGASDSSRNFGITYDAVSKPTGAFTITAETHTTFSAGFPIINDDSSFIVPVAVFIGYLTTGQRQYIYMGGGGQHTSSTSPPPIDLGSFGNNSEFGLCSSGYIYQNGYYSGVSGTTLKSACPIIGSASSNIYVVSLNSSTVIRISKLSGSIFVSGITITLPQSTAGDIKIAADADGPTFIYRIGTGIGIIALDSSYNVRYSKKISNAGEFLYPTAIKKIGGRTQFALYDSTSGDSTVWEISNTVGMNNGANGRYTIADWVVTTASSGTIMSGSTVGPYSGIEDSAYNIYGQTVSASTITISSVDI